MNRTVFIATVLLSLPAFGAAVLIKESGEPLVQLASLAIFATVVLASLGTLFLLSTQQDD